MQCCTHRVDIFNALRLVNGPETLQQSSRRNRTNVNETTVVLQPLHGASLRELLLVCLGDLRGLATHLTGTSEGSVHLTCTRC